MNDVAAEGYHLAGFAAYTEKPAGPLSGGVMWVVAIMEKDK